MPTKQKKTQLERVRYKIGRDGFITRNECLGTFPAITRLGARIQDLLAEGYDIKGEWKGSDYVYKLIALPKPKQLSIV
jgi:hypothetical protein